jgi:hypothetical protein
MCVHRSSKWTRPRRRRRRRCSAPTASPRSDSSTQMRANTMSTGARACVEEWCVVERAITRVRGQRTVEEFTAFVNGNYKQVRVRAPYCRVSLCLHITATRTPVALRRAWCARDTLPASARAHAHARHRAARTRSPCAPTHGTRCAQVGAVGRCWSSRRVGTLGRRTWCAIGGGV